MKLRNLVYIALLFCTTSTRAGEPFRGTFVGEGIDIKMVVDLYEESIEVPGMEMFGNLNGYLKGKDLYCTWYISTIREFNDQKAIVHFSNDLGSETQTVEMTFENDSVLHMKEIDGAVFKKVVGKKLAKLPTTFTFKRQ